MVVVLQLRLLCPQEIAFPGGCDSRFGIKVSQLKAVVANQDALIAAVSDQLRWGPASSGSANAAKMHQLLVGHHTKFWGRAVRVIRLTQPVMDAIHQLEGDKPLASQVYPTWNAIEDHFTKWQDDITDDQLLKADKVGQAAGRGVHCLKVNSSGGSGGSGSGSSGSSGSSSGGGAATAT
jgi:uncharacterized membrane protein YgcG